MSAAASASGTYGFSASLELDIDALEKKFEAYKEQSVGSNITAQNININADHTATVRGSNLKASDGINIEAGDTNILASQDVNNSSNSKKHAHLNISYGTAGGSVTASADSAKGSSRGITNTNISPWLPVMAILLINAKLGLSQAVMQMVMIRKPWLVWLAVFRQRIP